MKRMMQNCVYKPYLFIRSSRPLLPSLVCLCPNISLRVPVGSEALLFGITVTKFLWPISLVKETPWLTLRRICQPSFCSSLSSCLPVMAGICVYLGSCQLPNWLDARPYKIITTRRYLHGNCTSRSCAMEDNIILSEKALSFADILKRIKVQYHGFLKPMPSFVKCTTESRRTQLITNGYPFTGLFMKFAGKANITRHIYSLCVRLFPAKRYSKRYLLNCQYAKVLNDIGNFTYWHANSLLIKCITHEGSGAN